jgi:hypothetical protein
MVGSNTSVDRLPRDTRANFNSHAILDSGEAPQRSSRANLIGRLNVEKATATEARLRTKARLRARLAAERRLMQDDGKGEIARGTARCPRYSP